MRRTSKVIISTVLAVVVLIVSYSLFTYPRVVLRFPMKLSGAAKTEKEIELPSGHQYLQVEIIIREGRTLWLAKITFEDEIVWDGSGATLKKGQTTYTSNWVTAAPGRYILSITTLGSFDGEVLISSKGGFW